MKKIVIIIIILFTLLFPIKITYKDGGTVEYKAILYRVIKWHKILEFGEFKTGTAIIYFPNNFRPLDAYDEPRPPKIAIYTDKTNDLTICNTGSYNWSKKVGSKSIAVASDSISPTAMTYKDVLEINSPKIYSTNEYAVTGLNLYANETSNWYEQPVELNNDLVYNNTDKSIEFDTIEKGDYILVINVKNETNTAWYSCSIEVK